MTWTPPAAVVILAAGDGTRMKSATPKVLHRIGGRSLIGHAVAAARAVGPQHLVVVVRYGRDQVAAHVADLDAGAVIADQDEVAGTGRATECGLAALPADLDGTVVVTMGDAPLLSPDTLRALCQTHVESGNAATVITAFLDDPAGYGRILRDGHGALVGNVEHKDATPEQRRINEINSGFYAFDLAALRSALAEVGADNAQGERYLTDVLGIVRSRGGLVGAHVVDDLWQTEGVNDRVQLARLGAELNRRTVQRWMLAGVTVVDPATTWIDVDVALGRDVTVKPQTQLLGATTVGEGATIGPDTTLTDMEVADGATVIRTHGSLSVVGASASVGPFAFLRPGTVLGADGKIGTFVETKNAQIAERAKVPHLSYVGDAHVGAGANIGAGTIFANYDGVAKHHTIVGPECKTGANNTFVAPLEIGAGASTGAGTVVRRDVPPGALAVSTGAQRHLDGWVLRRRPGTRAAKAAEAAGAVAPEAEVDVAPVVATDAASNAPVDKEQR